MIPIMIIGQENYDTYCLKSLQSLQFLYRLIILWPTNNPFFVHKFSHHKQNLPDIFASYFE